MDNSYLDYLKASVNGSEPPGHLFEDFENKINDMWNAKSEYRETILKSQIFIEHFYTELLLEVAVDINQKELEKMSAKYKLEMLVRSINDPTLKKLLFGIRKLNDIRHKFAHRLDYRLSDADVNGLNGNEGFQELRKTLNMTIDTKNVEDFFKKFSEACVFKLSTYTHALKQFRWLKDELLKASTNKFGYGYIVNLIEENIKSDEIKD